MSSDLAACTGSKYSRRNAIFPTALRHGFAQPASSFPYCKINFELFLNRLLSTIWVFNFAELAPTISSEVPLSEVAASIAEAGESSVNLREFIIDKVVGNQGLEHFEKVLKRATQIRLRDVLYAKDFHYWPQIYTAFQARHLVEHRDGKVDGRFREAVREVWSNSSWGRRLGLERLEKVVVEEEDVVATHDAMLNAAELASKTVRIIRLPNFQWARKQTLCS